MSVVAEPVGHDAIRASLRAIAARRLADASAPLHHAWLFAGPAGVGKFAIARWWASLLKCPSLGACGPSCESCRLVAGAVHPDVFETGPAPKDKDAVRSADEDIELRKTVGIAESRALISRLALRPVKPGPRVAILREAGTMTPEAQNALLKLLEEPPGSAVIVLVTDNPGAMLATVRSRCRLLGFGHLLESEVAQVLRRRGMDDAEAEAAAACSRGSVARALAFDAEGLAAREAALLAYEALRDDPGGIEALVQQLAARKDEGYGMAELLEWTLAKAEAAAGRPPAEPSPALREVLDACAARSLEQARAVRDFVEEAARVEETIANLARNANPRLAIRDLLLGAGR